MHNSQFFWSDSKVFEEFVIINYLLHAFTRLRLRW